ncbi:DUF6446 family protein [Sulfitobacter aestuarii]|uniref:DUF6446 family protein n=1 Tax=Sulfitobacter aestuarii TaxID=2161676 RepID=A0ABW5U0M7_9RHOB
MNGKIVGIAILLMAAIAGFGLYYLQIYGFYREVPGPEHGLALVSRAGGEADPIAVTGYRAIDADSSPIRYRACFTTDQDPAALGATYVTLDGLEPRNAPGWFDCFDAGAISQALGNGTAQVFLAQKNIAYGVDRVVAITDAGQGFVWHELNECGEKSYDGTVVGEECPARPETSGD